MKGEYMFYLFVGIQLAGDVPQTEFIYSVEMKDLLFFVHSDHVFELCFHKAKTPISMAPFSMIFLGEFSIAIYNTGRPERRAVSLWTFSLLTYNNGTEERDDFYINA